MAVISNNPEETTGRVNKSVSSYKYPLNEDISSGTRLRFVKYDRFNPSDGGKEDDTAIIQLPLPITIPENYSINTNGQKELGMAGNVTNQNWDSLQNIRSGGGKDELDDMIKLGIAGVSGSIANKVLSNPTRIATLAGSMMGGTDMKDVVASFAGFIRNPHTTVLFEGVNLRPINLEWRFSPRSEEESIMLRNIFDEIKLRTHPEEILHGFSLNYPDLVYVEFTGKVAEYAPKFQKAFINTISIMPESSGGGMNLYKSGAPTAYTFQIAATELAILTRNEIAKQIGRTT